MVIFGYMEGLVLRKKSKIFLLIIIVFLIIFIRYPFTRYGIKNLLNIERFPDGFEITYSPWIFWDKYYIEFKFNPTNDVDSIFTIADPNNPEFNYKITPLHNRSEHSFLYTSYNSRIEGLLWLPGKKFIMENSDKTSRLIYIFFNTDIGTGYIFFLPL